MVEKWDVLSSQKSFMDQIPTTGFDDFGRPTPLIVSKSHNVRVKGECVPQAVNGQPAAGCPPPTEPTSQSPTTRPTTSPQINKPTKSPSNSPSDKPTERPTKKSPSQSPSDDPTPDITEQKTDYLTMSVTGLIGIFVAMTFLGVLQAAVVHLCCRKRGRNA